MLPAILGQRNGRFERGPNRFDLSARPRSPIRSLSLSLGEEILLSFRVVRSLRKLVAASAVEERAANLPLLAEHQARGIAQRRELCAAWAELRELWRFR